VRKPVRNRRYTSKNSCPIQAVGEHARSPLAAGADVGEILDGAFRLLNNVESPSTLRSLISPTGNKESQN
jgi:hypothetical protein